MWQYSLLASPLQKYFCYLYCACVGAVGVALGSGAAGTYTTSESMWGKFHEV